MKQTARQLALTALLTALALALSYTERLIPLGLVIPLPGVKLGLANIVTLFALYALGRGPAFAILTVRCLLSSLFGGGLSAFFFSITGGLLAMAVMALLADSRHLSIFGVSICGAAAHNVGQIAAAALVLKSGMVVAYLPPLLLVGIATGFITGTAAAGTFRALQAAGNPQQL